MLYPNEPCVQTNPLNLLGNFVIFEFIFNQNHSFRIISAEKKDNKKQQEDRITTTSHSDTTMTEEAAADLKPVGSQRHRPPRDEDQE